MSRHGFTTTSPQPYAAGYSTFNGHPPPVYTHGSRRNDSESMHWIPHDVGTGPTFEYDMDTFDHLDDHYTSNIPRPSHKETDDYLRRTLGIEPNRRVDLWGLPDSRKVTTSEMIRLAIWGSPEKRLTLAQICDAIEARYPQKRDLEDKPWRRTVRHHLSLKKMFEKDPRPADHPGKGNYWVLNIRHGEATRKTPQAQSHPRGGSGYQGTGATSEDDSEMTSSGSSAAPSPHMGVYEVPYKVESPPSGYLPLTPDSHPAMYERFRPEGRECYGGSGSVRPAVSHGYSQAPQPHGINPMLTMGAYPPPVDMSMGHSVQSYSHSGHGHPHPHPAPGPMPHRRRTYDHSLGMSEGGAPKATRRSRTD